MSKQDDTKIERCPWCGQRVPTKPDGTLINHFRKVGKMKLQCQGFGKTVIKLGGSHA